MKRFAQVYMAAFDGFYVVNLGRGDHEDDFVRMEETFGIENLAFSKEEEKLLRKGKGKGKGGKGGKGKGKKNKKAEVNGDEQNAQSKDVTEGPIGESGKGKKKNKKKKQQNTPPPENGEAKEGDGELAKGKGGKSGKGKGGKGGKGKSKGGWWQKSEAGADAHPNGENTSAWGKGSKGKAKGKSKGSKGWQSKAEYPSQNESWGTWGTWGKGKSKDKKAWWQNQNWDHA